MGKKKLVPGADALWLFNEGRGVVLYDYSNRTRNLLYPSQYHAGEDPRRHNYFSTHLGVETLSNSTDQAFNGTGSQKVVTPGIYDDEGVLTQSQRHVPCEPNTDYTFSLYHYGEGHFEYGIIKYANEVQITPNTRGTFEGTNEWTRHEITARTPANCNSLGFWDTTRDDLPPQALTYYIDALQLERGPVATALDEPAYHAPLGNDFGGNRSPTWTNRGLLFTNGKTCQFLTTSTTSEITVQAVIIPNINTNANRRIIDRGGAGGWAFAAGSKIGVWLGTWYYTSEFIQPNTPYCLGFTYDGTTLRQYNGAALLKTTAVSYAIPPGALPTFIGSDSSYSQNMEGEICAMRLQYRALTPAEMAQNAAALRDLVAPRVGKFAI
jgi:hypothetical protein